MRIVPSIKLQNFGKRKKKKQIACHHMSNVIYCAVCHMLVTQNLLKELAAHDSSNSLRHLLRLLRNKSRFRQFLGQF